MSAAADEMKRILLTIPNVPYQEVPEGKDSNDNVVEKMGGSEKPLPQNPLPHWEFSYYGSRVVITLSPTHIIGLINN